MQKSIESVRQAYKNWKIIVVDGALKDDTEAFCQSVYIDMKTLLQCIKVKHLYWKGFIRLVQAGVQSLRN